MKSQACLASIVAIALWTRPAGAQEHDHAHHDTLGEVDFPISCTAEAQKRFNTLVAVLYSFYWERVDAEVTRVLEADPSCAMAYWAKAVASLDNALGSPPTPKQEKAGWEAVEKARRLGTKTSREGDYVAAIEVAFKDYATVPFPKRAAAYEIALEQLRTKYPDDSEAAILYAFWLQVTADRNDQTYSKQLQSAKILEKYFEQQPRHPGVAHFMIHAYDFPPIAQQGLDAARRYASIAPDSPHALHMPSHIFSRVGQWQESLDANLRSRAVAKQDRDAYHALDYLVYAALQLGRDGDARQWVEFVNNAPKPNEETRQIAYAGAAIPARYALERGDWAAAARLELHPTRERFNWSAHPEGEAVNAYARGLGAARSGNPTAAQVEVVRLAELRLAMTVQKKDYWVEQANIQISTISAWIAAAEGRQDEAVRLMREAAAREDKTEEHIMMPGRIIPVREMLAELLLQLKQPAAALIEFEQSQKTDPNRFRNIYGAARAAELAGNRAKSSNYYAKLVRQSDPQADEREEIQRAKAFLGSG